MMLRAMKFTQCVILMMRGCWYSFRVRVIDSPPVRPAGGAGGIVERVGAGGRHSDGFCHVDRGACARVIGFGPCDRKHFPLRTCRTPDHRGGGCDEGASEGKGAHTSPSYSREPVISLVFPVSSRLLVGHDEPSDPFRALVPELCRDDDAERSSMRNRK